MIAAPVAIALAVLHVVAGRLGGFRHVPRSRALSVGSGVSVAYVFVHLLPEVAATQRELAELTSGALAYVERHAWVVALLGLTAMYGLEGAARGGPGDAAADDVEPARRDPVGWVRILSYTAYNAVIGFLLVERAEEGLEALAWFAVAMGVHFLVNDHALEQDHGALYRRRGRWIVAAGVLVGWLVAVTVPVSQVAVGVFTALLGGGVVLNVLKEELPRERESSFVAFCGGAAAYTVLLLAA